MNLFLNIKLLKRLFLEWLSAFTESFALLVSRVVGLFTPLGA